MKEEILVDDALAREHGLNEEEFELIKNKLGRTPSYPELGIFSVMWSEHCCYKSSRKHLSQFPTKADCVIHGPGENAGVIDIGNGDVLVFKMESHNHPSYIEPYQGAATGVGGILRDIFTMGARPIAFLDALRFGEIKHPKTSHLVSGVVSGIAGYGNSVGIPTVGGDIYFHPSYNGNILVNAFCMGVAKKEDIFTSAAKGKGNSIMYVGSPTGKDGIHGATMASDNFEEGSEERRPTVQVGDPFTGKRLIEATLEVMQAGLIHSIQDMGAAGLTCGLFEMADKGEAGMKADLDKVPLREKKMSAYEILLSESQERMLMIAKKDCEEKITEIFNKWDLPCVKIGEVTDTGRVTAMHKGKEVVNLPVSAVADAPMYDRPSKIPEYYQEAQRAEYSEIPAPSDYNDAIKKLLQSPNIGSKTSIFRQYDHQVGTRTVVTPSVGAAALRFHDSKKGVALDVGCNARFCRIDPQIGARYAVAQTARNVSCRGAKPMAITDCLNFGNPEKEEIMWQLKSAIKGISEACDALKTPVTGGNVSLYNENEGEGIYPTPMVAVVGIIDEATKLVSSEFKDAKDMIVLIGQGDGRLGGSEYLAYNLDKEQGPLPMLDLRIEKQLQKAVLQAVDQKLLKSAQSVGVGGLITTLIRCALSRKAGAIGFEITPNQPYRTDSILFAEGGSRIIASIDENKYGDLKNVCDSNDTNVEILGTVGGDKIQVSYYVDLAVEELKKLFNTKKW